ncbi:MAG: hypothetical protein ACRDDA_09625, partial [Aeromonas sp.]
CQCGWEQLTCGDIIVAETIGRPWVVATDDSNIHIQILYVNTNVISLFVINLFVMSLTVQK